MNNELIAAEQAVAEAERELSEARQGQAEGERQLSAGDSSVSAEAIALAPVRVRVAEGKLEAAKRALRAAEDAQPLPTVPEVRASPGMADAGKALGKAQRAAEAARSGLAKAEDALVAAQAKREAADATLAEALASDPRPALHVANVLVKAGAVVSNIEVTDSPERPRRSELPLLRIAPEASDQLRLEYFTKLPTETPPTGEAMGLALRLDGWAEGPHAFDLTEDGEGVQTWRSSCQLVPRAVIGWAESADYHGEQDEKLTDKLDLSAYHAALRDGEKTTIYSTERHAPLVHRVTSTGLHVVTSGMVIHTYTKQAKPLAKGTRANLAFGQAVAALLGAGDWTVGAVSAVKVLDGTPDWAGRIVVGMPPAKDRIVRYTEVTSVFRMPEGRELREGAFGSVDVAA